MASRTTTSATTTAEIMDNPFLSALAQSFIGRFEVWSSTNLTYTLNVNDNNPDAQAVGNWTPSLSLAITTAMADLSAVSNLVFTEVADAVDGSDGADIDFWYYNNPNDGASGYSYGVGGSGVYIDEDSVYDGTNGAGDGLKYGGVNYRTVVHELLHNLGLSHPHDGYASMPGVIAENDTGSFALNQNLYTVMSYNRVGQVDANGEQTTGYPFTLDTVDRSFGVLGAFDIAMIQVLYGANMTQATGDDVYELPSVNQSGTHYKAIWDAGGTDEFRYSGLRDIRIDLRAATLDLADGMAAGGILSRAFGIFGGYTIANGTVIENATGDRGDDLLVGNDADNLLTGNSGSDTLQGGNGRDTLKGGDGADLVSGGAGVDKIEGGAGADTLSGGGGDDWLYYAASAAAVAVNLNTSATSGGDAAGDEISEFERILGSNHDDELIGDNGLNFLFGNDGADTILGAAGNDQIRGGAGADVLQGGAGSDWLDYRGSNGGVAVNLNQATASGGHADGDQIGGFERLYGSVQSDSLTGNAGNNVIYANAGNDTLRGGDGNDVLRGNAGADVLRGGNGVDALDYRGSQGAVTVDLSARTVSGGDAAGDSILGFENVYGTRGADVIRGDGGNNLLRGDSGADQLFGGGGNDVIRGGAGADTLAGESGLDWLDYRGSNAGVSVNLLTGAVSGGHAARDQISGFERVFGSDFNDTLTGDETSNTFLGGDGSDRLNGGGGNDILKGQGGGDVFVFNAGSDTLDGGTGADLAIFNGLLIEFSVTDQTGGDWLVTHVATGDIDVLFSVEILQFDDMILS